VRAALTMGRHPPVPTSLRKNLATQCLLVATYVLAGKIGLTLALLNSSATAVWPPTGIALAAVLILGPRRAWLGIFVGAFLVNEVTAGSFLTSLAIACGNTGEALVGGYLVDRFAGGRTGFVRSGNLFLFAGLAGVLSTTVSATIGVTTLYLAGYATLAAYGSIWTTWWLGDAAGAMLVAPVVLLWHAAPRPQWSRQQQLEILILGLTTVLVAWTVFVRATHALPILCVPVCVWAGLRFGQREASTTACAVSAIAVWGTLRGHGALASDSLNTELLLLQAFMATTSLIALVVGAAVEESKRASLEARRLNDELEQRVQARTAELQAAYDHLVTSGAQLKEAQELAHVGSWEWNVADNSAWWSEELYRICGTNPESFTPKFETFMGLLPADDRGKITDIVQKAFADRQPFQCEHRIIRSDDGVRVMHSLGRVVVNDAGQVVRMVGVSQDITDRKAGEEVVSRSERRLQTIIDAQPACVTLVSLDGLLLDMNRAGLEMVGAEDFSQLKGRPIIDLVHPDDRNRYLAMHRAASSGSPGRMEFRLIGLKGDERWVDSHAVPFETSMNGSDTERAVLSVSSDVTERKRLEEQLRRAQQMEAVGQLAGGIAHDFNNLLTAISGFTEFVLLTLDEADSRRADLIEVRKASARAASLTRRLLAFSRRQILQTKVFDLNSLVSDIQKLLNRTIGEDIELILAFDPALEPVRADPSQLEQVVLNLAVNARDAMPKGGQLRFVTEMVDIDKVAAERRAPMPPGRYVRLTITDTGTGMSPEIQQHMFEPFFTTKDRNKGTGLGLATVHGIVEQSGGYVSVTSRVGLGTSFEIYLPPVQEAVQPLTRLEESASLTGGTETVLLAEDDGAVRRLAGIVLRHHGYTVLEARDGEEALQVARSDRRREIHLLVTDVVMPGLSGRDLALQLAADRPEMRVLYTSGYVEAITMRAGLERGMTLLAKPFLPNDLVQRVRETLDSTAHPSFGELQLHDWMSSPASVRSSG
jgi:two-component system cell cycle sensor histidine kinase/response regulator CckA